MSDIVKKNSAMLAIPGMFKTIAPPPLKTIKYNAGLPTLWWENKKLTKVKEMHQHRAEIAEAQLRETKAISEGMMEAATFGPRLQFALEKVEHDRTMMKHEETTAAAKAANACYEAKIVEIDWKRRDYDFNEWLKSISEGA